MNSRSLANLMRLYSQARLGAGRADEDIQSDDDNYSSEGEEDRKQPENTQ